MEQFIKTSFLIPILFFTSQLAVAYVERSPKVVECIQYCTRTEIESVAPSLTKKLAKSGKVDASWSTAKIERIEQRQFSKGTEWIVTFLDRAQKDQNKQRLFVFVTSKGFLTGASFTRY